MFSESENGPNCRSHSGTALCPTKKKLNKTQRKKLDEAVKTIMANPAVGKAKSGDLQGVRTYKYKIGNKQILLAYEVVGTTSICTPWLASEFLSKTKQVHSSIT